MQLPVTGGGNYQQAPAGTHSARCIKLIDLGTQKNEYQGDVSFKRQLIVSWELPNELMTGEHEGKPFVVSKFYTYSMNEKATFRKDLQNWLGKQFTDEEAAVYNVNSILNQAFMLGVVLTEKGKAKVASVMGLPKGMVVPEAVNPIVFFSLDEFTEESYNALTDGLKAMIANSPEYKDMNKLMMDCGSKQPLPDGRELPPDNFEDGDIPF